ncbi:MAG: tetratricopeptide repeat protein [Candidatus Omnitrophica bacterium]|nr:tetratricopeptide repeat protein [Candidatus Omnitrophota bacterium]
MSHSEHTHAYAQANSKECTCDHGHDHGGGHSYGYHPLRFLGRWLLTVLIVGAMLILLRPFVVQQMFVRVVAYSANSSYSDVIRLCKKIIVIDKDNKQAWASLGYAYMDLSREDMAIPVFKKVLLLDPDDKQVASFELGQAYYSKGDFVRAIGYFERVRSAGSRASALLEADILKYRHGTLGFRSLNSMQTLLGMLLECYKKTGNSAQAKEIQKQYDFYKNKHSRVLF